MRTWLSFWFLALLWGSSFLLMKLALVQLTPTQTSTYRLLIAGIFFVGFLALTKRFLQLRRATLLSLLFVGLFNTAIPFTLIAWGTQRIDSGLATILTGTVPFFSLVLAHFILKHEDLNGPKMLGLLLGFAGVFLLGLRGMTGKENLFIGQLAVLASAFCYAMSLIVLKKYLHDMEPISIAGYTLIIGAVTMFLYASLTGELLPASTDWKWSVLISILLLGFTHTTLAYFFFYHLVEQWGPRASLVTYAMPPIGVALGVLVLDEPLDWRLLVGGLLVLWGIVLSKTGRFRFWKTVKRQSAQSKHS